MVGFTAEGLVWEGDQPRQGLHLKHREYVVARPAAGGEPVELLIEAAANPIPPWGTSPWPLLMPDVDGAPIYRLAQAELAVVRRDVEALYFDMLVLSQLLDVLPADGPRAAEVLAALEAACDAIDGDDAVGAVHGRARAALAPALATPGARRRAPRERDRSRAHRLRVAVADPRDEAQVRAHVRERAPAHGRLSRVPLLRVAGAAVRVDEGPLPAALRAHPRPGAAPVGSSRSAACGSRPTATSRRASRWCARSCTASGSSSTSSAARPPTSGSPTCSATPPRCRRS